ncbi:MAG: hypothetical protein IPK83_17350 [Planctomycetes bacterium]|nr:hypothetical protein [Planctomycetota bacterium]
MPTGRQPVGFLHRPYNAAMALVVPITKLTIFSLAIPMRRKFSHSAAERVCSEPLVVCIELSDGTLGWGETHPRTYVTGESHEDAIDAIRRIFVPLLVNFRPTSFGEAIEATADLPMTEGDRPITAARAAVEIALLDAYGKSFGRSLDAVARYLEEPWLGLPGSRPSTRHSVVVSSMDPDRAASFVRKVRYGLIRDFKLKVGDDADDARLRQTVAAMGAGLRTGKTTLRIDANSAWDLETATQRLSGWRDLPITCCEQPLAREAHMDWPRLAEASPIPLMADESLVTLEDAEDLVERRSVRWFNIRISKNGGLIPAIKLAILARRHNLFYQLGCMVGETSILSAAGRWFLQLVPHVRFAEGSFGRFLLSDDIVKRSLRFGFGGRWKALAGPGLGINVDPARVERLAVTRGIEIPF